MIELIKDGIYYIGNKELLKDKETIKNKYGIELTKTTEEYKNNTISCKILNNHNSSDVKGKLELKFDCLASHDITYVGIIQTARASGLEKFPIPYVLTNCHNSLCAVGGTINEDDHVFGLSAAKKYGGIFVPAHLAVIHTYMREMMSGSGKMILGSDSHTRYGALGTLAIGEGGPEIAKQLLGRTYDIDSPEVVAVHLTGKVKAGVGPQDVALSIIGAVFKSGFAKNKILEFIGDGIYDLPIEYRNGIDVMTTETTCLSSVWATDEKVYDYYKLHGRTDSYKKQEAEDIVYYDSAIIVDLSKIECMVAMPFHPSNVYTIRELNENLNDIINIIDESAKKQLDAPNINFTLKDKIVNGRLKVNQGVIAGCAGGTFDNICAAADIINGKNLGSDEFALNVYPGSQPVNIAITKNGTASKLLVSGAVMHTAFCGPCFGANDVPANNGLSIRHSTRNFPNREGSKPSNGQIASVMLMDARSIAATAVNGGILTPATDLNIEYGLYKYTFDKTVYDNRVYNGYGKADTSLSLKFGPNIADWPSIEPLKDDMLMSVCSVINDEVTTTDELIPSGETSSYRSNPYKLAEFTLSRKDPLYVGRTKKISETGKNAEALNKVVTELNKILNTDIKTNNLSFGSVIFANKPGDGSAREQAASSQRVLGGSANIAREYATKRYRSNLINWGMIPFIYEDTDLPFENEDYIYIKGVKQALIEKAEKIDAFIVKKGKTIKIEFAMPKVTEDERAIILSGCLMNYYADKK